MPVNPNETHVPSFATEAQAMRRRLNAMVGDGGRLGSNAGKQDGTSMAK